MQEEEIGKYQITNINVKKINTIVTTNVKIYTIYGAIFNKLNYKEGDFINEEDFKILEENANLTNILEYLIKITSKKTYSSKELKKKCNKKYPDQEEIIQKAIDSLTKINVIDDKVYVNKVVNYFNLENYGKYYICNYLIHENISKEIINDIVFDEKFEYEKAMNYFTHYKNFFVYESRLKGKKDITKALLERGFGLDTINNLINNLNVDEEKELKLLKKDFDKIKSKYEKKINDKFKLKNKIINELIKIGYSFKEISECLKGEDL